MRLANFLLEQDTVRLQQSYTNWQAALKAGVDLLVRAGACEPRYYDAILAVTLEHGPFYMIGPHIAMPHARPEAGALATGVSLVTLQEPLHFGSCDHDGIQVLLTVCTKDRTELKENVIHDLMDILDDEERVKVLCTARSIEDIKKLFV